MSMSSSTSSSEDESSLQPPQPANKKQRISIPPPPLELPNTPTTTKNNNTPSNSKSKIIVLLDQAHLETIKTKHGVELLNCDMNKQTLRKHNKDPKHCRPDICHQELLALIDSPLNKAGHLQIYIRTKSKVLIQVHPQCRIPRTMNRFSGLMVQLLQNMKIKSAESKEVLLKVIKNPFSQYLPTGTHVYGFTSKGKLFSPAAMVNRYVQSGSSFGEETPPVCFIIGAMATGAVQIEDHPYIEEMLCISKFPLSGAAAISRIMGAIEQKWGIV